MINTKVYFEFADGYDNWCPQSKCVLWVTISFIFTHFRACCKSIAQEYFSLKICLQVGNLRSILFAFTICYLCVCMSRDQAIFWDQGEENRLIQPGIGVKNKGALGAPPLFLRPFSKTYSARYGSILQLGSGPPP